MNPHITYTSLSSKSEIEQLLRLQQSNRPENITPEVLASQGFVTVVHTPELMQEMNSRIGQIIAKNGTEVVGYALVMAPQMRDLVPVLVPMFEMIEGLSWKSQPLKNTRYYAMGQICVKEGYRGMGVFDGLYEAHRQALSSQYDLCITEVAVRNTRSMAAHTRVGFKTLHTYQDATDLWNLVLWDWTDTPK